MTDSLNEKISALMDDQLNAHEVDDLVERMQNDQPLQHCWTHYHLIGDALRNNLPNNIHHDLAARVSASITAEAPLPISLDAHRHAQSRADIATRPTSRTSGMASAFFKPLVGMAIAASVAAVAIVSFNVTNDMASIGQQQLVMAPLQNNASMIAEPVVARVTDQALVNSRLAGYLEDHSKYSTTTMVQGQMLPYVRMVGYAPKE